MFKKTVTDTQLTSQEANYYFQGKVDGSHYAGDVSFLASLRALVAPRMGAEDRLTLSFRQTNYSAEQVAGNEATYMIGRICDYFPNSEGVMYIHDLRNRNSADNVANIELLKQKFCEVYPGWEHLKKVSDFYQQSFNVICFLNPEKKSAAMFVDRLTVQKLHFLEAAILAYFPWYFDPKNGVSENEKNLLLTLMPKTSSFEGYIEVIAEIAKQYDFESARLKRMLTGFEAQFVRREKTNVERQIRDTDSYLADYHRRIGDYNRQRAELSLKLLGIEMKLKESSGDSEILDYFQSNRSLYLVRAGEERLEFIAKGYMQYWDEDMAKRYLNNSHSYFYDWTNGSINYEQMKKLMWAVFIDQTIKVRFCSAYTIQLANRVSSHSSYTYPDSYEQYLPNPHIHHHACLGNYESKINKLIGEGNYVMAIEQCVASAKSLNISDSAVMRKFVNYVIDRGSRARKFFELPDGRVVNGRDAVAWMEQQEAGAKDKAEAAAKAAEEAEKAAQTTAEPVSEADEAIIDEVIAETTQADVAELPF